MPCAYPSPRRTKRTHASSHKTKSKKKKKDKKDKKGKRKKKKKGEGHTLQTLVQLSNMAAHGMILDMRCEQGRRHIKAFARKHFQFYFQALPILFSIGNHWWHTPTWPMQDHLLTAVALTQTCVTIWMPSDSSSALATGVGGLIMGNTCKHGPMHHPRHALKLGSHPNTPKPIALLPEVVDLLGA